MAATVFISAAVVSFCFVLIGIKVIFFKKETINTSCGVENCSCKEKK